MTNDRFALIALYLYMPLAISAPILGLWQKSHPGGGRIIGLIWAAALLAACVTTLILKIRMLRQPSK
jgi:hypothetical protein